MDQTSADSTVLVSLLSGFCGKSCPVYVCCPYSVRILENSCPFRCPCPPTSAMGANIGRSDKIISTHVRLWREFIFKKMKLVKYWSETQNYLNLFRVDRLKGYLFGLNNHFERCSKFLKFKLKYFQMSFSSLNRPFNESSFPYIAFI